MEKMFHSALVGNNYGNRLETEVVIGNFSRLVLEGKITNTPSSYSPIVWSAKKKSVLCWMPHQMVCLSLSVSLSSHTYTNKTHDQCYTS